MDECVAVAVAEAVAVAVTVTVAEADQSIHDQSIHNPQCIHDPGVGKNRELPFCHEFRVKTGFAGFGMVLFIVNALINTRNRLMGFESGFRPLGNGNF